MAGRNDDFDEDDYETEPPSLRELERLIPKLSDRDGADGFDAPVATDSGLFDLSPPGPSDEGPLFDAPPADDADTALLYDAPSGQHDEGLLFDSPPSDEADSSLVFDPPASRVDDKSPFSQGTGGFERLLRIALLLAVVGGIAWLVTNNSADKGAPDSAPGIAEDMATPADAPANDAASAEATVAPDGPARDADPAGSTAGQSAPEAASQPAASETSEGSVSAFGEPPRSDVPGDSGTLYASPDPSTGQLPDEAAAATSSGASAEELRTGSADASGQNLALQQPDSASAAPSGQIALPLNQAPPVNKEGFGTLGEVRWCVFESKRLDYLKAQLRYDVLQNLYTERAADYNQRCPSLTGTDVDWQRAETEFQTNAETIRAEASAIQSQWAQSVLAPLVRDIQRELTRLGYYSGPADGVYSSSTASAVNSFTAANGLPVADQPSYELLGYLKSQTSRGDPPLQPRAVLPASPPAHSAGGVTPEQRRAIESACAAAKAESEELNDQCWSQELRKLGL